MSKKNTGISFFNSWGDETRGLITHVNDENELFIQVLRYNDNGVSAISISLTPAQIHSLLDYINKNYEGPF